MKRLFTNFSFVIFYFDCYIFDNLYGFGFIHFKFEPEYDFTQRSLFSIYYSNGIWFIDLFWLHIIGDI
jgi:hypothetical protein